MRLLTKNGFTELDRKAKIELLTALQTGEIKPEELSQDAIIVSDPKQCFIAMQIGVAHRRKGNQCPHIIHIGEAAKMQVSPDLLAKVAQRRAANM